MGSVPRSIVPDSSGPCLLPPPFAPPPYRRRGSASLALQMAATLALGFLDRTSEREVLTEALEGAQVVVDVANAPAWDDAAMHEIEG